MNSEGLKRARNPNFSAFERNLLMKLANKKKNILENKKTDAVTNIMKATAWSVIAEEFNSACGRDGQSRDAKCLKSKYECIKKEIRKKLADKPWKKTGGGPYQPPPPLICEEEAELTESILLSAEGLEPVLDSDNGYSTGIEPSSLMDNSEDLRSEVDVNWQKSNALMLQTSKSAELSLETPSTSNMSIIYVHDVVAPPEEEEILGGDVSLLPGTSTQQPAMPMPPTPHSSGETTSRRRPVVPKKRSMNSASAKFEVLAETKLKLVELRERKLMEALKNEEERHKQEMKNLKAEEEIKKLQAEEIKLRIDIMKRNNLLQ